MDQPLKGKVFCGDCGSAMTICYVTSSKTHERYAYYKCAAKKRGLACPSKMIRKDELEDMVSTAVLDMLGNPAAKENLLEVLRTQRDEIAATSAPRLDMLRAELSALQKKIKNSVAAILDGLSSPELIAQTNAAEARKAEIEEEIKVLEESIEHSGISDEVLPGLLDKLLKNAKTNVSALLSAVIRVEVYEDTIKIWTIFDDGDPDHPKKIDKDNVSSIVPIDADSGDVLHKYGYSFWRTTIYAKNEIVFALLVWRPQKIRRGL